MLAGSSAPRLRLLSAALVRGHHHGRPAEWATQCRVSSGRGCHSQHGGQAWAAGSAGQQLGEILLHHSCRWRSPVQLWYLNKKFNCNLRSAEFRIRSILVFFNQFSLILIIFKKFCPYLVILALIYCILLKFVIYWLRYFKDRFSLLNLSGMIDSTTM